jgi:hypothetical protein
MRINFKRDEKMKKIIILIMILFYTSCEKTMDSENRNSTLGLFALLQNAPSANSNIPTETGSESTINLGLSGDFTNNTPAGAKCINNGSTGVCAACNVTPTPSVSRSRTGAIVNTDDVDWYCYNITAAGTATISTERSDGFLQPKATDTFISVHQSSVAIDFACTSPYSCSGNSAQQALDDDSNRTAYDPVRTYSLLERTEAAAVTRYIRVGLATNNPGAYRIKLVTKP